MRFYASFFIVTLLFVTAHAQTATRMFAGLGVTCSVLEKPGGGKDLMCKAYDGKGYSSPKIVDTDEYEIGGLFEELGDTSNITFLKKLGGRKHVDFMIEISKEAKSESRIIYCANLPIFEKTNTNCATQVVTVKNADLFGKVFSTNDRNDMELMKNAIESVNKLIPARNYTP